jgi:hypothetical protein
MMHIVVFGLGGFAWVVVRELMGTSIPMDYWVKMFW